MAKIKQIKLGLKNLRLDFGGARFASYNPNQARPMAVRTPIHVVLRSPIAKAHLSLLFFDKEIRRILKKQGDRAGVKVYDFANAGNHLHFVCTVSRIEGWKTFIRAFSGLVARLVLKAERGAAVGAKFWQGRPWTRILTWGRAYRVVRSYIALNKTEAFGFSRKAARIMEKMGFEIRLAKMQT